MLFTSFALLPELISFQLFAFRIKLFHFSRGSVDSRFLFFLLFKLFSFLFLSVFVVLFLWWCRRLNFRLLLSRNLIQLQFWLRRDYLVNMRYNLDLLRLGRNSCQDRGCWVSLNYWSNWTFTFKILII